MNVGTFFRAACFAFALGAPALVAIACSDAAIRSLEAVAPDASAPPVIDPGPRDAASDGADAAVDATPRACSLDGFCHTVLPASAVLRSVWGDGLGVVWAVGDDGTILRWGGASWSIAHTVAGRLFAIWGSGPTDLWAGGDGGLFHGTGATSNAITWKAAPIPGDTSASIRSIWGTSANRLWAVGHGDLVEEVRGRVVRFTDAEAGASWSLDPISSRSLAFNAVWGAGDEVWLAAGGVPTFGPVPLFRGAGDSWTEIAVPSDSLAGVAALTAVGAPTADDVWIFGRDRRLLPAWWHGTRSATGTLDWTSEPSEPRSIETWAIWGTSRTDVWSVGDYGRARHWDGDVWTQAQITLTDVPFTRSLFAAWGDGKGELWFVGDNVALHRAATP